MGDVVFAPALRGARAPRRPLRVLPRRHATGPARRAATASTRSRSCRRSTSQPAWTEYDPLRRRQAACPAGRASRSGSSSRRRSRERRRLRGRAEPARPAPPAELERGDGLRRGRARHPGRRAARHLRRADGARRALPRAGSSPRSRSGPRPSSSGPNRAAAELGWEYDENSVAGCYVEPLDTYCDMTHLIPRESWQPADGDADDRLLLRRARRPRGRDARRRRPSAPSANAIEFVERDLGALWPGAAAGGAFDWERAGRPRGRDRPGALRLPVLARQHLALGALRAHARRLGRAPPAVERLGLRQPHARRRLDRERHRRRLRRGGGDLRHGRGAGDHRRADADTGRQHRLAAAQPRELPRLRRVRRPRHRPVAVRPARAGACRACCCEGDGQRIATSWTGCSTCPPGRASSTASLGSNVMLLIGDFERVTSLTQPFDRWGAVRETQASFWIPVLAGRDLGDVFIAERLAAGRALRASSTTRCPTWAGARPTATRRRWGASIPRAGLGGPRDGRGLRRRLRAQ